MDTKSGERVVDRLEMMASIGPECNELKRAYDNCFNAWFADNFLKGDNRLTTCDALLASYTNCVKEALKARNVDLGEIDKDHLNTSQERRKP